VEISMRDRFTLHAIVADAKYAARVAHSLKYAESGVGPVALFCVYNYLSLFVYESHKQLKRIDREYGEGLVFSEDATDFMRRSRHSLKLFEDTGRSGVDGVVSYFNNTIIAGHAHKFLDGVRFQWARFTARDLGIYTYDGVVVSTSHGATFALGVTPDELFGEDGGPQQGRIAEEYGRYFDALTSGTISEATSFVTQMQSARLSDRDVRADRVYVKSFNGRGTPAVNGTLSVFQSLVNTADLLLPLDTAPAAWQTTLKMRFLAAYQILSSLTRLRENGAGLRRESLDCIDAMLRHPIAQRIVDPNAKPFRNTLIHYGPDTRIELSRLALNRPVYGLIEFCFAADVATFDHDLTVLIRHMARVMNEWAAMNSIDKDD
jgi:hypothetical protein